MKIDTFLEKLKQYWETNNIPNISRENAFFLCSLLKKHNCKNILEIWTASGYSTIHFANTVRSIQWRVTTIEFSQWAYEMAYENIQSSGLQKYITQYFGDAREIIPLLEETYDFIFIDGLKKASLSFFLLSWEKLWQGWIVVIDDVIKFQHKMTDLYEYLDKEEIPYTLEKTDGDDGIMILKK